MTISNYRAYQILKERHLLIENGKTVEAHTHLVIEAMEEYADSILSGKGQDLKHGK